MREGGFHVHAEHPFGITRGKSLAFAAQLGHVFVAQCAKRVLAGLAHLGKRGDLIHADLRAVDFAFG
ncbi:hypothetical protein D3C85_1731140 [compost metagenome]